MRVKILKEISVTSYKSKLRESKPIRMTDWFKDYI